MNVLPARILLRFPRGLPRVTTVVDGDETPSALAVSETSASWAERVAANPSLFDGPAWALTEATEALVAIEFGLGALSPRQLSTIDTTLRPLRRDAGDF